MMDDKKQVNVCIANCAPIPILIKEEELEIVQKAQDNVTHIWNVWRDRYSNEKSAFDVMAMVAFQYAKLYYSKEATESDLINLLSKFEKDLDSQILKTE